MTSRTATRLQLGDAAILSPREACEMLPWRDDLALAWLRKKGLVHEESLPDGSVGDYVLWDEVRLQLKARNVHEPRERGRVHRLKRRAL